MMDDTDKIQPWKETYRVRSYEAALDGMLSLPSLCDYLQEIAGNHARELGLALGQLGRLTWVLHRLRVSADRRPAWGEDVEIITWPSGHNGLAADREFLISDASGICARASSQWLLFDLDRRRPVRLPDSVTTLSVPDLDLPLGASEKMIVDATEVLLRTTVRRSDLDMNGHVNNVRYLHWMMDTLTGDTYPIGVDIVFKSEALLGDEVDVLGEGSGPSGRMVSRDGKVMAMARFELS
jgi:medium-chain acyl-[acyl-carrier-protein] hydrolase